MINRQTFSSRLQAYFDNGCKEDDIEWYALRNAIYASGCKIHLSKLDQPQSFEQAQCEAWKYFENALSVHTELIYMRSGFMAIQALVTMVCNICRELTRKLITNRHSSRKDWEIRPWNTCWSQMQ